MVKVKVCEDWLAAQVDQTFPESILRFAVQKEHGFIGTYQFDVRRAEDNSLYGVRVLFEDERLYRNRLYITPPVGAYEFLN